MSSKITINVQHRLHQVIEATGPNEWQSGTTTIEAETSPDGDVLLYIQTKGFGKNRPTSIRTRLDDSTVQRLSEFLREHLELTEKLQKVCSARNGTDDLHE